MTGSDRASLAAFARADPAVARFLAAIPASSAWVVDALAEDPVTVERVCGGSPPAACTVTPELETVNAAIRRAERETEHVVVVVCPGARRVIELRSLPAPGASGDVIMTLRDVTAEEALKAKLQASATKMRELRLAAAVHDAGAVHLALSDPLTGLPNRRAFDIELAEACRNGGFALALFDMDRFKAVNDDLGHPVGDRLLRAIGDELRRHTRSADFIARLGGDEFAVILHDLSGAEVAREAAERLMRSVAVRIDLGDIELSIGLSAGVAVHRPGEDPAAVYREADMAMLSAKARQRGTLVVSDEMEGGVSTRDALKTVKSLLSGRPIVLAAVPVRDAGRRVVAREVTVGGASAASFDQVFATAVRFGHGRELLEAVLRRVAEGAACAGPGGPAHVRLPAHAVAFDGLVSLVIQSLARAGADPAALAIEIPLAACLGEGVGESVAERLADAGITVILGDWDMSFAAFRAATEGRFALVALDAAAAGDFAGAMADVWRAAFRSLAASGVGVVARNVATESSAGALLGLGVPLITCAAAPPATGARPSPHYA